MIYDIQKASMWKRISAFLFDGILLVVLITLLSWLLSSVLGYDGYISSVNDAYAKYETQYGVSFEITEEDYNAMSEQDKKSYDDAYAALIADSDAMYAYNMMLSLTLVITSVSILLSCLALEFVVPLLFGNGQTLGKKIFSLCLMKTDGIRINTVSLFVRTILGKFTIEIMIPVLIVLMIFFGTIGIIGPLILLGIIIVQIVLLATSQTNSIIHDRLANTVVVDYASQMIFDSEQALLDYKKKVAAEKAERQDY